MTEIQNWPDAATSLCSDLTRRATQIGRSFVNLVPAETSSNSAQAHGRTLANLCTNTHGQPG